MLKLNLGCGTDIRSGWINVDKLPLVGVDVVVDLDTESLPFPDRTFVYVVAKDVLEHCVRPVPVLDEIQRVLAVEGLLEIQVPHFTSRGAASDPTHVRSFSIDSFHFAVQGHERSYYFQRPYASVKSSRITFEKSKLLFWNSLLERLVNLSPRLQRLYEKSPLRIFPALNVVVVLKK